MSGTVELASQISAEKVYLADRLNGLICETGLKRFRAAVSYVRWSGLGLIANSLEDFLKAGGKFHTIYGVGNGITTPDSLLYSLYLMDQFKPQIYAGAIEDKFQNAAFHAKFFEFQFNTKIVALIGSANLTGGGLLTNTEMALQVEVPRKHALEKQLDEAWNKMLAQCQDVTLARIRKLKQEAELGSELDSENPTPQNGAKPFIPAPQKPAPKPLYLKVLNAPKKASKEKFLRKLDPLTQKPVRLYLQIMKYETGSQKSGGTAGYQIQLPVATLEAFFGVAPDETQSVEFRFGAETIKVHLTHFGNNTHRVRLKPLRDIKRPAIVVFERAAPNVFDCTLVPASKYASVLAEKCVEQTRAGARKWGLT
ncbi:hypothetical protein [Sinorhizobium prairiense]|uniref:hypothetical protein n=1 Tax=unclassified Sinorhizobium TaxID=2613772 RepID=UPI0023D8007C|nr:MULTISPECIES: hypothetical protein [unclassified Sinorhizobium]WEJ11753.1 hypothetical protein N0Q90_21745 [Sinorhizobium sp. M103]WEJ17615.1 hypothetical protein N0Q91_20625 [Sinorhizobium sp. K101]WEJ40432.1 hypothetical protein N0R80_27485 [Sinorhizobium sp. C101]